VSVAAVLDVDDNVLLLDSVSKLAPSRGARKQPDGSYMVLCPGHDDKRPSLQVGVAKPGHKYRLRWHCHAGCPVSPCIREAATALGVPDEAFAPRRKRSNGSSPNGREFDHAFRYHDANGNEKFESVRYRLPDGGKEFLLRRPDGNGSHRWGLGDTRPVLYRLQHISEAVEQGRWVVIPEGEKCADRLVRDGFVATTSPMGAGKWRDEYASCLAGAKVAILPDNDDPGRDHAARVATSLHGVASSVRVITLSGLPDKGDVFDWFEQGHAADELKATIESAAEWEPAADAEPPDGVQLIRASDIELETVDYLDDKLIPLRVVTLVTGVDGVGKSTLLYAKAALATRGKLPGAFKRTPVDVVIASSEDHPGSVILPRLIAAGSDLEHVHIVQVRRDGFAGDMALPDDLPKLEAEVMRVGARFLIIDPLVAHLPLDVDSHKAQHVRSVMAPLQRLAETAHLAVAVVVHFNGAPSTDVRTRTSGSKALRDASRSVIVCGENPEDKRQYVMVQDKNSNGPKPKTGQAYRIEAATAEWEGETFPTCRIVWCGEVETDSRLMLAGPGNPEERDKQDEACEFLSDVLGDHEWHNSEDVKKAAHRESISDMTLARARRSMRVRVERSGFPSTSKWSLPVVPTPDDTTGGGTTGDGGTTVAPQRFPGSDSASEPQSYQTLESGTTEGLGVRGPGPSWSKLPGSATSGKTGNDETRASDFALIAQEACARCGEYATYSVDGEPRCGVHSDPLDGYETPASPRRFTR
jgi:putative DNA primase/helicase